MNDDLELDEFDREVGAEVIPMPTKGKRVWLEDVDDMLKFCDSLAHNLRIAGQQPEVARTGRGMTLGFDHESNRWYAVALYDVQPNIK